MFGKAFKAGAGAALGVGSVLVAVALIVPLAIVTGAAMLIFLLGVGSGGGSEGRPATPPAAHSLPAPLSHTTGSIPGDEASGAGRAFLAAQEATSRAKCAADASKGWTWQQDGDHEGYCSLRTVVAGAQTVAP